MGNLSPLLFIFTGLGIGILFIVWWSVSRGRMMLERWTTANGYRLLSSEHRWFQRGPFLRYPQNGMANMVYFVVVQTPEGKIKRGWVLCGSFWWGMLHDKTEVRWEE